MKTLEFNLVKEMTNTVMECETDDLIFFNSVPENWTCFLTVVIFITTTEVSETLLTRLDDHNKYRG